MRPLLTLLCIIALPASEYLDRAEAALTVGERERGERMLHFARAAGGLDLAEQLWLNGRLAALQLRMSIDDAPAAGTALQRWHLEQVLIGRPMDVDDWRAYRALLRQAPDDPFLRRFHDELLPDWVAASGHDEHGPWLGLACGARLMRFRIIPAGTLYCDDGRALLLSRNILIAETPCTLGQWRGLFPDEALAAGDLDLPASGQRASRLVQAVAELDARIAGARLRLPTPEEWEFAARALHGGAYLRQLGREDAVFDRVEPAPVRRHGANDFGLYDVHGGVWELCRDRSGQLSRRGGSWRSRLGDCAFDRVLPVLHDDADPTLGIRLVIEP